MVWSFNSLKYHLDYRLRGRMIGKVLDVNVLRGASGGIPYHYLLESRVRVGENKSKRGSKIEREVLKLNELYKREKDCEHKATLKIVWNVVKEKV
ncbi:hypothetical protein SK128_019528 [Halocaridina rubra]|uniref:Uncharacterized protein n=1 Tax=Halocaridina rubra TaxID=373956 RepID=A0AAN9A202_HALRR